MSLALLKLVSMNKMVVAIGCPAISMHKVIFHTNRNGDDSIFVRNLIDVIPGPELTICNELLEHCQIIYLITVSSLVL